MMSGAHVKMTMWWHSRASGIPGLALSVSFAIAGLALAAEPPRAIEFNRDVRPILADHCFQCHGPDAKQRKAELRLDVPDAADSKRDGGPVVVAGQPEKSELWRRINSADPDERMPPPEKGGKLTAAEIATLEHWIIGGGKFEKHWSLLPVRRSMLPAIQNSEFRIQNSIDAFVLARLEKEGIGQSSEADRPTLLRRVTLALTGLPPTPNEVETFLDDHAPDAYERAVDRLLASPRYGERMAVPWLDAARYADTSGYQSDGERFMWRWRDWVIEALNANMPFDQFTIEQIAGDMLPEPTLEQRIATGFNRNHRGNAEGGIIPEEYAVEYVADRVETTATVWLGLTLGCCRCHDHKYDPFTQRDFYSLFAFFNNVPEKGRAIKLGNSPPYIQAPTRMQVEQLQRLQMGHEFGWRNPPPVFLAMLEWEQSRRGMLGDWYPADGLVSHLPLDQNTDEQRKQIAAESPNGNCDFTAGRLGQAGQFDGTKWLELPNVGNFGFFDKFSLAAWIYVKPGSGGTIVSHMVDEPQGEGYQLAIVGDKLQFNLSKRWLDDALRVETADSLLAGTWRHVVATYDGMRAADGVKLFVDGEPWKLNVLLDELNQTFATKEPLRIGGGGGPEARFRGAIDEVRVYARALDPEEVLALATPQTLDETFLIENIKRTPGQAAKLRLAFLEEKGPEEIRTAYKEYKAGQRKFAEYRDNLPTVMVMEEMPTPRESHILIRGQYDKPGERVEPNLPAELPPLPADVPRNRLGLGQWLVDPANPLTSRVIVNRVWQLHFGTGIVKTAEDFGRQGEWPSHPGLLDWLAAEFTRDWDVKGMHRRIVESATFRQSSAISDLGLGIGDLSAAKLASNPKSQILNPKFADPDNRLLSRGPRLRLSAEMIRDQALFASGLLVEQLGGPSVKPLQPPGLWSELTGGDDYQPGSGADLYRRSLYTFWKRTIPPPTLSTFDSPTREACVVRESRTNTPLQSLALMNEPTFVAAAQALAKRVMREAETPTDRIERVTIYALGRRPTQQEQSILAEALNRYRQRSTESSELAGYTLVCSTIMNLDEAVTSQ